MSHRHQSADDNQSVSMASFFDDLSLSTSTLGGDSLTVEEQKREMHQMMANLEVKDREMSQMVANLECRINATDKPNKWAIPADTEVLANQGRKIIKIGEGDQLTTARAQEPIRLHKHVQNGASKCHSCHCPAVYFELRKKSANGPVWIGLDLLTDGPNNLAAAAAPFSNANLHAGAWPGSVGLDSEGHLWIDGVQKGPFGSWEEELEVGEFLVLGCGLVPSADGFELFFTRNGKLLGLETLTMDEDQPQPSTIYPLVSLSTHGTIVEANFDGDCPAKPFHYNPGNHEMKKKIREALLVATQELVQLETTMAEEKVQMRYELLVATQELVHLETTMAEEKVQMRNELLVATQEVAHLKTKMAEEKVQMRNELHTVKGEMGKRLDLLENDNRLLKLREEERLRGWLCDGAGRLRNVTLLRVPNQQLETSPFWGIEANSGGLKVKITKTGVWAKVRAIKPFPLGIAQVGGKFLHYFEVTVTGFSGNLFIGLCVGDTAGCGGNRRLAVSRDGEYGGSGTSRSGPGKGPFVNGDVIGCGVLVLPTECRLFFTKNGVIWVKPILLEAEVAETNLYPFACAYSTDTNTEVQFNFGGDLASKPFNYALSHLSVVDA